MFQDVSLEITHHLFLDSCVNDKVDGLCRPPHILPLWGREENPPGLFGAWLLSQIRQLPSLAWAQDHRHHLAQLRSQPGAFSLEDAVGAVNLLPKRSQAKKHKKKKNC